MSFLGKRKSKGEGKAKNKRRKKPGYSGDEGQASLSSKYAEPPISKIYNSRHVGRSNTPAELFRKDLISAMKMPDSEPLDQEDYILIEDSWRPEWEKGVQVPVDPDALPENKVTEKRKRKKDCTFKLPKKLVRTEKDEFFSSDVHCLRLESSHAEQICRYDMDDTDMEFLEMINEDREDYGLSPVDEYTMEKVIDEIETVCLENFQDALRAENGIGGEIDEDAICDVCRSPDSEEGNEIVFCDACNMCVHQSCYGIVKIPEGSWICRTCALNVRPSCLFCPARGGAMKPTINGEDWCHVSCAIWMPEVSFQHVEKMEPITKVHLVPPTRWALECSLCPDKSGACIQCSFKSCKVAYHVTCAVREGLKMKAIMREDDDALKLKSFCHIHSKEGMQMASSSKVDGVNKNEMDFNDEVAHNIREGKLHEKEAHFYNYVTVDEVAEICQLDKDIVEPIFNYWKLKRRANHNRPLLPPRDVTTSKSSVEESYAYTLVKKLVILRRDLERARNLCFMVKKREKIARSWITTKKEIFMKQIEVLQNDSIRLTKEEYKSVILANDGDLTYDKIHTGQNGPSPNTLKVLNGLIGEENTKIQLNGILKNSRKQDQSKKMPNPYAKHYLNGLLKRSQRWLATVDRKKQENMYSHCDTQSNDDHSAISDSQVKDENNDEEIHHTNSAAESCGHQNKLPSDDKNSVFVDGYCTNSKDQNTDVNNESKSLNNDNDKKYNQSDSQNLFDYQNYDQKIEMFHESKDQFQDSTTNSTNLIKEEYDDSCSLFSNSNDLSLKKSFDDPNASDFNFTSILNNMMDEEITNKNASVYNFHLLNNDLGFPKSSENSITDDSLLQSYANENSIGHVEDPDCVDDDSLPVVQNDIPQLPNKRLVVELETLDLEKVVKDLIKPMKESLSNKKRKKHHKNNVAKESKSHQKKYGEKVKLHKTSISVQKIEKKKKKSNIELNPSEFKSVKKIIDDDLESHALYSQNSENFVEPSGYSDEIPANELIENANCRLKRYHEGVFLNDKLPWGTDLNPKVVLSPLDMSDTDTNDSLSRRGTISYNEQNVETSSSIEVTSEDSHISDQLSISSAKNTDKEVFSSKRSSSPMQKQEDSPKTKTNKLVEHIIKESKLEADKSNILSTPIPRKGSLTGYKIPKKKAKPESETVENSRGNSPLSPLTDRVASSTTSISPLCSGTNSYQTWSKPKCVWKTLSPSRKTTPVDQPIPPPPPPPAELRSRLNGDMESQIPVKLRPCLPAQPQWRPIASSFHDQSNFHRPQWGRNFQRMHHTPPNPFHEDPRVSPWHDARRHPYPPPPPHHHRMPRMAYRSLSNT